MTYDSTPIIIVPASIEDDALGHLEQAVETGNLIVVVERAAPHGERVNASVMWKGANIDAPDHHPKYHPGEGWDADEDERKAYWIAAQCHRRGNIAAGMDTHFEEWAEEERQTAADDLEGR